MDYQHLIDNSYRNFHAKGLDYLCLKRTPGHTVKLYVFNGDATKLPEVVNPHDHRYAFKTTVLRGAIGDRRFQRAEVAGNVYQAFDYMTPLNGGNGFTFRGNERLRLVEDVHLDRGHVLNTGPEHTHTIYTKDDQTVLLLEQFADVIAPELPTSCWVRIGEPKPDTSGLYEKFTEAEYMDRLANLFPLLPAKFLFPINSGGCDVNS
jgi:hypothetical protein